MVPGMLCPDVIIAVAEVTGHITSVDREDGCWRIFTDDGCEYMMFEDDMAAVNFTVCHVAQDIKTGPEMFDHGWLNNFIDLAGVREDLLVDATDGLIGDDPVQHLKDVGYYGENLVDMLGAHIDIDKAARDAVARDGPAHFLTDEGLGSIQVRTGHVLFKVA